MLSSCLSGLKLELSHFQSIWRKYSDIWNIEREVSWNHVEVQKDPQQTMIIATEYLFPFYAEVSKNMFFL